MRRCPKCNRSYAKEAVRFCTNDGEPLVESEAPTGATTPLSSPPTSSPLAPKSAGSAPFDPFKTVMNSPPVPSQSLPEAPQIVAEPTVRSLQGISVPAPARAVTPSAKKSKAPLVIAMLSGVIVVLIVIVVGGYLFYVRQSRAQRSVTVVPKSSPRPQPTKQSSSPSPSPAKVEEPPVVPPPNSVRFVNSKSGLEGKLAEHYVDFSFFYPKEWVKDSTAGVAGATNFARVERRLPPDFTQESFAVGWYSSSGSEDSDRELYPSLVAKLSSQFKKDLPEYRKVSEGETKVGVYSGYEFRFEAASRNTVKGDLKIWGRAVFLSPPEGEKSGVTLLMLTTSLAPELRSVNDVGVKGELPIILNSFRLGK